MMKRFGFGRELKQISEVGTQNRKFRESNVSGFKQKRKGVSGQITGIMSIFKTRFSGVPAACSQWAGSTYQPATASAKAPFSTSAAGTEESAFRY